MPRGHNINTMDYFRLEDLLEYENKDPNLFLRSAIECKRIDLLPLLFDHGAKPKIY